MITDIGPHLTDDQLAGIALADAPAPLAAAHLDRCPNCRRTLSGLLEVLAVAADDPDALTADGDLSAPPPDVWRGISEAVDDTSPVTSLADRRADRTRGGADAPPPPKRSFRPFMLLAAMAAGVLVGAGLVAAVDAWQSEPTIVASAELTPVPGGPSGPQTGTAAIERVADGEVLAVSTTDLADPSGFYEVWLLNPATGGMIAMGAVPGGSGTVTLPVPNGVDLSQFPAVDISDEPLDGDPGHSSVSVLRGELAT